MNAVGVVGVFAGGLIEIASLNLIPLWANHWMTYVMGLGVGLVFTFIWFVVFRFLILKFDFKTPGREDDEEIKFRSKAEYRAAKQGDGTVALDAAEAENPYAVTAAACMELVGGPDNIVDVTKLRDSPAPERQGRDEGRRRRRLQVHRHERLHEARQVRPDHHRPQGRQGP